MKPLWDSAGAKPQAKTEFPTSPIEQPSSQLLTQMAKSSFKPQSNPITDAFTVQKTTINPNPVTQFQGTPYYKQSMREGEEETIYLSVPESGLAHPTQPKFVVDTTPIITQRPKESLIITAKTPDLFTSQTGRSNQLFKQLEKFMQTPTINIAQAQQTDLIPALATVPIQVPALLPKTIQTPKTTPTTTTPPLFAKTQPVFPSNPLGAKYVAAGWSWSPHRKMLT